MSSKTFIDLTTEDSKKARPIVLVLATAQYSMINHSQRIMQFLGPSRLRSVCSNMVRNSDVTTVKFSESTASATTKQAVITILSARRNIRTVDVRRIASLSPIIAYVWIEPFIHSIDRLLIRNDFNLLIHTNTSKLFYNDVFPDPMYDARQVLMTCMVAFALNDHQHAYLFASMESTFPECLCTSLPNLSSKYTVIQDNDTNFKVCIHELMLTSHGVVPALNRFYRWHLRKDNDTWMVRSVTLVSYMAEAKCSLCAF